MKLPVSLFPALALFASVVATPAGAATGDRVGETFHDVEFLDPSGQRKQLSDYRGEVVVVKLWATWCGVCRKKWPAYQALHDGISNEKDVRVVTLSIFEDPADSQAWVDAQGFSVPLYTNLITNKGAVALAGGGEYFIKGTPMVFLIDRQGVIVKKTVGFSGDISAADVRQYL